MFSPDSIRIPMRRSWLRAAWFLVVLGGLAVAAQAQRQMERLGRGVVAVRASSTQVYIGWRLLGNDPEDVAFNLYRGANGGTPVKINATPLTTTTDYTDTPPNLSTTSYVYSVKPVVGGVEVVDVWAHPLSAAFTLPANAQVRQYLPVPLQPTPDGSAHKVKFCWVGDLDGDGEYDFVIDRLNPDAATRQFLEAYKRDGTFLWRMDMGPNSVNQYHIEPGSSAISVGHGDNVTVYDLDGDGLAEVIVRTANGVVFGNGATLVDADDRKQYLSIVNGMTGAEMARALIPNPILSDGPMNGKFGIFYPDGVRPSVLLEAKNRADDESFHGAITVWDWRGGVLSQRWSWLNLGSVHAPEGHQIRFGDVDNDGKDEFIDIGFVLDDHGTQLFNLSEVVHGDRFHVTDIDPDRPGLENFIIQQNNGTGLATALFDAGTGSYVKKWYASGVVDVGRGVAGDFDAATKGLEMFSTQPGTYDAKGNQIHSTQPFPPEAIWWDADLGREFVATVGSTAEAPAIEEFNPANPGAKGRMYTIYNETPPGVYQAYGGRPAFWGDLFGDWREELLCVANDNSELRIYTPKSASITRLYTLMHNPQYRCQTTTKGYVQASYVDYYLGYGMTPPAPPPMVDAQLVWRGGAGVTTWDAGVTPSWRSGAANSAFADGNTVRFDISGDNATTVALSGALQPGAVTVWSPKSYFFDGTNGALGGAMKFVKAGEGMLTVSGNHSFTGKTTVWDGALLVNGVLQGSAVTVWGGTFGGVGAAGLKGGRIGGTGTFSQPVAVKYRGAITPGAGMGSAGTLNFGAGLTLEDGSVLALDLSNDPAGTVTPSDRVAVTGNLALSGKVNVLVKTLNGTLAPGTYTLLTYTGALTGSLSNLAVTAPVGVPYTLAASGGAITLTVPLTRAAASVVWRGSGGAWDLASSQNWLRSSAPDIFVAGDAVTFDATGATAPMVTLSAALPVASLTVNAASDYTFTGVGSIYGAGGLTKNGTGMLTINTTNDYTGPTTVNSGVLAIANLANAGTPSSIGAASASASNLVLNGGTLRLTGLQTNTNRSATLGAAGGTLEVALANSSMLISGSISGSGALTKAGPGTLLLGATNTYTGGTIINGGTIYLAGSNANRNALGSGAVTLNNGTLTMADVQNYDLAAWNLIVPAGATGWLNADGRCTLTGTLSGGGMFNFYTGYVRTELTGNWSAFTGVINVVTDEDGGDFRLGNGAGMPAAEVHLAPDVYMYSRAGTGTTTFNIGALSGEAGSVVNAGVGSGAGANYPATWRVGGRNTDAVFAGVIQGTSAVIKTGTATWTLSGANTYTGATTVQAGALIVTGSLSGSNVTVQNGATLGGNGTITGDVTINAGGRLAFVAANGTISGLNITGNLALNGTISVTPAPGSSAVAQGSYTIATYSGTLSGSPTFVWSPPPGSTQIATFDSTTPGVIRMNVTRNAALLTWVGNAGATWDTVAANWKLNGVSEIFVPPDSALFDDTAVATAITVPGPLEPGTVTFAGATKNFSLATSGGGLAGAASLLKTGAGTLTLSTANTFTGGTTVAGGTIALANDLATSDALGSGTITLSGGTVQMFDGTSSFNSANWKLHVPAAASGTVRADSRIDLNGTLTGSGILNFYVPWVRTTLLADWSAFTGRINVTTDGDGGDFRVANATGHPTTAIHLDPRVAAYWYPNSAATVRLGELSGEPLSQLRGVVNNNNTPGAHTLTWEVGGLNTDATFSGNISNGTSPSRTAIRKVGAGTWTLAGTNSYTGPTTVVAGTLRITGALSGTTALTIDPGATVELSAGSLAVAGTITNNGTVRVIGQSLPTSTGSFINNGILDLITGPASLPANLVNNGVVLDSRVVRTQSIALSDGVVNVSIQSHPGHVYRLQRTESLSPVVWQDVGAAQSGTGGVLTFSTPVGSATSESFYRILISP